jgi:hypothetical protein
MDKIYVHVLSNIIGLDFYLKIEELVIKHYIDLNILNLNKDNLKQTLLTIKRKLINNKLEDNNLNYQYISTEKNPENVIKELKESLKIFIDLDEIINTFETKLYPYYRDLYRITFKYLQMFMSNYHKFIYNQYHGLNILLLLLDKISS